MRNFFSMRAQNHLNFWRAAPRANCHSRNGDFRFKAGNCAKDFIRSRQGNNPSFNVYARFQCILFDIHAAIFFVNLHGLIKTDDPPPFKHFRKLLSCQLSGNVHFPALFPAIAHFDVLRFIPISRKSDHVYEEISLARCGRQSRLGCWCCRSRLFRRQRLDQGHRLIQRNFYE